MPTIDFAVLCDHAFFDQHGRLCVAGITQAIPLPRLPMTIREIVLASRIQSPPGEQFQATVRILQPGGGPGVPDNEGAVQLEAFNGHLIATIRNLPLPIEGTYTFEVLLNGASAVTLPLVVKLGQGPAPGVH